MTPRITRRRFLAGTLAGAALGRAGWAGEPAKSPPPGAAKRIDLHVHLFGLGDAKTGCRLSPVVQKGPLFQYMAARWGLRRRAATVDESYVLALVDEVKGSGLDRVVLLAQDAVYGPDGRPDWEKTHFYVPNDYLLAVCKQHARRLIPCVSVNPARRDAMDELARCLDQGARVLKIHPPTQGVDVSAKQYAGFFRRCADRKVLVMIHTGHEHACPTFDIRLADPRRLALALGEGCTVVACHCGTGWAKDAPDMVPAFLEMLRKHANLWGDTSILGSWQHAADFKRLLAEPGVRDRLLHGSDFPFESTPMAFADRLGWKDALRLHAIPNALRQDLELKEALGVGRASPPLAVGPRWT